MWTFFQLKNNERVDASKVQTMQCIHCHPTVREGSNSACSHCTRSRKGIMVYNVAHGSTSMRKHVNYSHAEAYEKYEKEIAKERMVSRLAKKNTKNRKSMQSTEITRYFGSKDPYKKCDQAQQDFILNLIPLIAKDCIPLSMVNSQWMRRLVLQCDPRVVFPFQRKLVNQHIPSLL